VIDSEGHIEKIFRKVKPKNISIFYGNLRTVMIPRNEIGQRIQSQTGLNAKK